VVESPSAAGTARAARDFARSLLRRCTRVRCVVPAAPASTRRDVHLSIQHLAIYGVFYRSTGYPCTHWSRHERTDGRGSVSGVDLFAALVSSRMSNESAFAPRPSHARSPLDRERLSQLLAAAAATVDSDHDTAKDCIRLAEELVRVCSKDRFPAVDEASIARGGLATWQLRRIATYVEARTDSNIRLQDLAHLVQLSKSHFSRAFRQSVGEPPMSYVARHRILRAQKLMRDSQSPLSAIALACGMCDQAHLTRVFGRIVGMSPAAWRRMFAGDLGRVDAIRERAIGGS